MLTGLKWLATGVLIMGTFVNAGFPEFYPIGPAILILGGFLWLGAGIMMRDAALITTNLVMSVVALAGLIFQMFR